MRVEEIAPSFTAEEIYSPLLLQKALLHIHDVWALTKLQTFRDLIFTELGCGLYVNVGNHRLRGVRSVTEHNDLVKQGLGAKTHSMHVTAKAFDISLTRDHSSSKLASIAKEFGVPAIGVYRTFIHIDFRVTQNGDQIIWRGQKK